MTSKIVAFTFTLDKSAEPTVTRSVEANSDQKEVITRVMKRVLPSLKKNHEAYYNLLTSCPEFTVSFAMPADKKKFSVKISNTAGVNIVQPLNQKTCDNLIRSLQHRATSPVPPPSVLGGLLPILNQRNRSIRSVNPFVNPLPPQTTPSQEKKTKKTPWDLTNSEMEKILNDTYLTHPLGQAVSDPIGEPKKAGNFLYRFFAAIFSAISDYFRSFSTLFSSDTDELHDETLIPNQETHASNGADQTKALIPKLNHGIRPLYNENNICFINGSFQPLMNMTSLIPVLIEAHKAKIEKETAQIRNLQPLIEDDQVEIATLQSQIETYSWYDSFVPEYNEWVAAEKKTLDRCTQRQKELDNLQKSIQASKTLIQACEAYKDETQKPVWLNALRGFDPLFRDHSQEDAHDLLVRIWDPVLEPLRSKKDIGVIPATLDPTTRTSLGRFIPKVGEEKQLERVARTANDEVTRRSELAAIDPEKISHLPQNGLWKELVVGSSIPFAVPALAPEEKVSLQNLVTTQLTMQDVEEQDGTSVYDNRGVRGDYQVTQKRIVIESVGDTPPEFLTLHLKRFISDGHGHSAKNEAQITLPTDNRLTMIVNEKNVNYEIHAVEVHRGTRNTGHYFAYIRNENGWVEANDERVVPLTKLPESVEKDAYIIFLKRVP